MLVSMSSHELLADAGQANAPQFNAIFYATVATIIPVLFIGAALQADSYAKLIDFARAEFQREGLRHNIASLIGLWVPFLILAYGVWGEIQALIDLYLGRPVGPIGPLNAVNPLIAAAVLVAAVAIGPAVKYWPLFSEFFGLGRPAGATADAPGDQPPQPSETRGVAEPASPETEAAPGDAEAEIEPGPTEPEGNGN
jgi:hypothetical protein